MTSAGLPAGPSVPDWTPPATYLDRLEATESAISHLVVNVLDAPYNAAGDGVTNDTAAIQAAINAVQTAGGGRVLFPNTGLPYLVNTATTASGLSWILTVTDDNVHLDFEPGATLKTTVTNASLIFASGAGKPAGMSSWATYWLGDATRATYYAMSAAARGDRTITLTTPAQASNFAAGDLIYVRTGQTIAASLTEPDSEINEVRSANAGTGVLTLRYPLAKPYVQEYFISGTTGATSTSVTANAATFGVAKVTDRVLQNFKITGLTLDARSMTSSYALSTLGCFGVEISGLRGVVSTHCLNNIECRAVRLRDWDVHAIFSTSGTYKWPLAFGTGCSDGVVEDVQATAEGSHMWVFHVHEGAADVRIIRSRCVSPAGDAGNAPLSVRARSYGFVCRDSEFVTYANNYAAYVSGANVAGGLIENIRAICKVDSTKGLWIDTGAVGWEIRRPDPDTVVLRNTAPQAPTESKCLTAWLADDQQNPSMGPLPVRSFVTAVRVHVTEAFNSDGTDQITVGYDASTSAFATAVDVSTTGYKTVTLGTGAGYNGAGQAVEAYYVNGGSEPTTGKALVTLEYYGPVPGSIS